MIESNPELFKKFTGLRLAALNYLDDDDEEEEEDAEQDENEENEVPLETTESSSIRPQTPTQMDLSSPEQVPPARSLRKVVRVFSADQSVVEVLPENHGSSRVEPPYVKDINFQILRLPNSHQKIGSSQSYSNEIASNIAASQASSSNSKNDSSRVRNGSTRKAARVPVSTSKKNLSKEPSGLKVGLV